MIYNIDVFCIYEGLNKVYNFFGINSLFLWFKFLILVGRLFFLYKWIINKIFVYGFIFF